MRRFFAAAAAALCLTAAGCRPGQSAPPASRPVTEGFTCEAAAVYAGMTVRGTLTRETGSALKLEVEEPETLRGAVLTLTGETLTVSVGDLQSTLDSGQYPKIGALPVLLSALDAAAALPDGGDRTAEGLRLTGETDTGRFTLLSDPDTGCLRSLTLPDVPLTVTFSRVRLLTPETSG